MLESMPFIDADEYATFRSNPYFIEGLEQLQRSTRGDVALSARFVRSCTWAVLTPDTIARRNGERLMSMLAEHGLYPIATRCLTYNRNIPREYWRRRPYTLIRAARVLVDIYLPRFESLAVVLRADDLAADETAAARLHRLKGPAQTAARSSQHIRYALGTKFLILNGIHAPDSPLDFITDVGVFLADLERGNLLETALAFGDAGRTVEAQLAELYRRFPTHDFDVEASRERLAAALLATRRTASPQAARLHDAASASLGDIRAGQPEPWLNLLHHLQDQCVPHEPWDVILLGAATLEGINIELRR